MNGDQQSSKVGGGDRGAGDREKRGREVYGRREKRGREAGFPRWREAGEKGENYATLRNVSQSKKCKGAGAKKHRAGTGIKGYGKREVQTLLSPPPPHSKGVPATGANIPFSGESSDSLKSHSENMPRQIAILCFT